jgi:hypothetical protein
MRAKQMVKAWRVWTIAGRGVLQSCLDPRRTELPCYWSSGENKAVCKFHEHSAPDADCRCGFRGQSVAQELIDWLYDFKHLDAPVIGGVRLSGAILTGDKAHPEIPYVLRAEYAEVIGPLITWDWIAEKWGERLSRTYNVKVLAAPSKKINSWYRSIDPDWFQFEGGLM